jgi:hypothetical protein
MTWVSGLCVGGFVLTSMPVRAAGPFPYLAQALSRVAAAGEVAKLEHFDYAPGNSLLGTCLRPDQSQRLRTWLQAGQRYLVIGAGDEDVLSLNLEARTDTGLTLDSDLHDDPVAVLDFRVPQTGWVTLEIKNRRGPRAGFCAMVILRETSGREHFSLVALAQALRNSLSLARVAGLVSTRFAEGNFCVFGGRLNQGEDTSLYNFNLNPGHYVAVAVGSDGVKDVDLSIVRQYRHGDASGTTIASDTDAAPVALCGFQARSGEDYCIGHKNCQAQPGDEGFVFTCLLQL